MTQAPSIKEALERRVALALMQVKARPPACERECFVLSPDPDFDDLPANGDEGTADDEITQEAVLRLARAALATLQPSGEGRDSLGGERRDAIAKELWHRFSPPHHIDWESEPHKGEYLKCADEIISLLRLGWFGSGLVQDEAGWRDISTAPKDGTEILAYRPLAHLTNDPHVIVTKTTSCSRTSPQGVWHYTTHWCHPTHWMPLPAPPIRSACNGGAET